MNERLCTETYGQTGMGDKKDDDHQKYFKCVILIFSSSFNLKIFPISLSSRNFNNDFWENGFLWPYWTDVKSRISELQKGVWFNRRVQGRKTFLEDIGTVEKLNWLRTPCGYWWYFPGSSVLIISSLNSLYFLKCCHLLFHPLSLFPHWRLLVAAAPQSGCLATSR